MTLDLFAPARPCVESGSFRSHLASAPLGAGADRTLLWVCLNPSTAGAERDDPTTRKISGFTPRLGFGRWELVNLFAFRATKPHVLRDRALHGLELVGPSNDMWTRSAANGADAVLVAWGSAFEHCAFVRDRVRVVLRLLAPGALHCLGCTASGAPRHPLMLPYSAKFEEFRP